MLTSERMKRREEIQRQQGQQGMQGNKKTRRPLKPDIHIAISAISDAGGRGRDAGK